MNDTLKNTMMVFGNDLNNMFTQDLTSKELNVLMTVFLMARDRGIDIVKIPVSELRDIAVIKGMSNKDFCKDMESFDKKINSIIYKNTDSGEYVRVTVFDKFYASKENMTVCFGISTNATYLFNDLNSNFTRMNLCVHNRLSLKASKILYRNLCQYRTTGYWRITLKDFINKFGISPSYETRNIKSLVINPAIRELSGIMDIKCNVLKNTRSRSHETIGYEFFFRFNEKVEGEDTGEAIDIIPDERSNEDIARYEYLKQVVKDAVDGMIELNDMQINMIANKAREAKFTDEQLKEGICTVLDMKEVHSFMAVMIDLIKNPKKYEEKISYRRKRKKQEWEQKTAAEEAAYCKRLEEIMLNRPL
jgi:hypothetical protein